jgi:hypothetical protein
MLIKFASAQPEGGETAGGANFDTNNRVKNNGH